MVFVDGGYEQTRCAMECVKHGHVGKVQVGRETKKIWFCWTLLKGSGLGTFTHEDDKTGFKDERIYSRLDWIDPNIGKEKGHSPLAATDPALPPVTGQVPSRVPQGARVPFYNWSNLHVKDILRRHRDQDHAPKFLSLPDEAPQSDVWSYTSQMNSELRDQVYDDKGRKTSIWRPIPRRPNLWWDCEAMFIAVCAIVGIIGGDTV